MKQNKMTSIYLLGIEHSTNKSKTAIIETFALYKFKALIHVSFIYLSILIDKAQTTNKQYKSSCATQ